MRILSKVQVWNIMLPSFSSRNLRVTPILLRFFTFLKVVPISKMASLTSLNSIPFYNCKQLIDLSSFRCRYCDWGWHLTLFFPHYVPKAIFTHYSVDMVDNHQQKLRRVNHEFIFPCPRIWMTSKWRVVSYSTLIGMQSGENYLPYVLRDCFS